MKNLNKDYNKFTDAYTKLLNKKSKALVEASGGLLDYFITALKFLRDDYILKLPFGEQPENLSMQALTTAISEYELSNTCVNNYYDSLGHILSEVKEKDETKVKELYEQEKAYHWGNFWSLVMLNIEERKINA